jgi:lipoate-protein ligase A
VRAALLAGFADTLGLEAVPGEASEEEERLAARILAEEIGTEAFVAEIDDPRGGDVLSASHTGAGGTVTAWLRLEAPRGERLREVLITGDFFVTPPRTVYDLESALRGVAVREAGAAVERFFAAAPVDLLSVTPSDFRAAVEGAIAAGGATR